MATKDGDGFYGTTTSDPMKAPKGIVGRATVPLTGEIGEYKEAISVGPASPGSATWSDGGSVGIVLPIGVWDLNAIVGGGPAAGTTISVIRGGIATTSGATSTGIDYDRNAIIHVYSNGTAAIDPAGNGIRLLTPVWRVVSDGTKTYYPKIMITFATSTCTVYASLFARRVA